MKTKNSRKIGILFFFILMFSVLSCTIRKDAQQEISSSLNAQSATNEHINLGSEKTENTQTNSETDLQEDVTVVYYSLPDSTGKQYILKEVKTQKNAKKKENTQIQQQETRTKQAEKTITENVNANTNEQTYTSVKTKAFPTWWVVGCVAALFVMGGLAYYVMRKIKK
ncbi:MAG: hypothetical protein LBQ64_01850 [Bacteroidales bacterium]|jgi:flagellar motor protein MotB|nr:hypothetical protein [Bacteroidales bacterium]